MNVKIKKWAKILGVLSTPIVTFYIFCYINSDRVNLDGKTAELLSVIFYSDTQYAKGYSHKKFGQIRIGMSEKQVMEVLGEPLYKWKPYGSNMPLKRNYIGFVYSSDSKGSYRLRQINFNNGKVVEIIHYFYID